MNYVPRLRAGAVWINTHNFIDANMSFGGMEESGSGREFGMDGVNAFTELKLVCIAH